MHPPLALRRLLLSLSIALAACGGSSAGTGADAGAPPDLDTYKPDPLIVARPYDSFAPANYDGTKDLPLVLALHGVGINGFLFDAFLGLSRVVDDRQFLLAVPTATKIAGDGTPAWNVGDPAKVDDMAYLDAVMADMARRYRVDAKRVFVIGHSNGSAMTYRLGCERADRFAAIVPFAGSYTTDPMKCKPSRPVSVLNLIGDKDGGWPGNPPLRDTVAWWATSVDGCGAMTDTSMPSVDLEMILPGAETSFEKWTSGCKDGTSVELWLIAGGSHSPNFKQPLFANTIIDWFYAHARR